jgi:hypothetical protein
VVIALTWLAVVMAALLGDVSNLIWLVVLVPIGLAWLLWPRDTEGEEVAAREASS